MRREKEEANKEARVSIFSLVGVCAVFIVYTPFTIHFHKMSILQQHLKRNVQVLWF